MPLKGMFLTMSVLHAPSYGVALSYVAADAFEKGWKERQRRLEDPARTLNQRRNEDSDRGVAKSDSQVANMETRTANMETSGGAASPSSGEGQKADVEAAGADTWPPVAAALDSLMWHGLVRYTSRVSPSFCD